MASKAPSLSGLKTVGEDGERQFTIAVALLVVMYVHFQLQKTIVAHCEFRVHSFRRRAAEQAEQAFGQNLLA